MQLVIDLATKLIRTFCVYMGSIAVLSGDVDQSTQPAQVPLASQGHCRWIPIRIYCNTVFNQTLSSRRFHIGTNRIAQLPSSRPAASAVSFK
jgi:hypothetical protein